jgi:16S rRNA (cytosine967-C5)-methyltransferase
MTPGARLAAAGEILTEVLTRRLAADRVLKSWGRSHRFAGSRDRAAIGERVYGVLRRLGECGAVLGRDDPRSLLLGSLIVIDGLAVTEIDGSVRTVRMHRARCGKMNAIRWSISDQQDFQRRC